MERSKAYLAEREKERKVGDIKFQIERQEELIALTRQTMNSEIESIQVRKTYAMNNLAGATLENSLATEMQAVTARYTSEIGYQQDQLKRLQAVLSAIK